MAELQVLLLTFLKAIGKYRWYAVSVAWLVAAVGWLAVYRMPDDYQATARVYVDTQSILKPLLAGMTTVPNVDEQVNFMRRTLISRPNVEKVMRMTDLDIKSGSVQDHERMVDEMTANIKVGGTERDDIYTLSYNNPNPRLGKQVVQSLLTIFVEGSFGGKKQDNDKAVQFIDDQIKSYGEKLATGENALKDFKIRNLGMLPAQGGDYSTSVGTLTDQLNAAKLDLAEAEQSRNAIKRQIGGDEPAPLGQVGASGAGSADSVNPELDARIDATQKTLDTLRLQYTEVHPDIVANKRLLASLEQRKKDEARQRVRSGDPGLNYSPMLQQMNVALSVAEAKVAALTARVTEYSTRLARLQAQSREAPEVEAQLAQLNRDYAINKENYNKLVERREAARLSGDLTSATDMLSFRVIDPPSVPQTPVGPNRGRLVSVIFGAALLAGLGTAFLMSQIRPTFVSQASLRNITGLVVLGAVGMNWTAQQTVKRRQRLYAFGAAAAALAVLYGGVMATLLLKH